MHAPIPLISFLPYLVPSSILPIPSPPPLLNRPDDDRGRSAVFFARDLPRGDIPEVHQVTRRTHSLAPSGEFDGLVVRSTSFMSLVNEDPVSCSTIAEESQHNQCMSPHEPSTLFPFPSQQMARYFSLLPTCPRKLNTLPYHLEVSASWAKLKDCLVDVDM